MPSSIRGTAPPTSAPIGGWKYPGPASDILVSMQHRAELVAMSESANGRLADGVQAEVGRGNQSPEPQTAAVCVSAHQLQNRISFSTLRSLSRLRPGSGSAAFLVGAAARSAPTARRSQAWRLQRGPIPVLRSSGLGS